MKDTTKAKRAYMNPAMCRKMDCPCLGGVCVHPDHPVIEIYCPWMSGTLHEFIENRLKECNLRDWTIEEKTEQVLQKPDDYPRIYSGDGKHYSPMTPKWKREKVLKMRKLTLDEACLILRRHEKGLPPEIGFLDAKPGTHHNHHQQED